MKHGVLPHQESCIRYAAVLHTVATEGWLFSVTFKFPVAPFFFLQTHTYRRYCRLPVAAIRNMFRRWRQEDIGPEYR